MMADKRQTAKVPNAGLRLAVALVAAMSMSSVAAGLARADSPAVDVNPKALDAVPAPAPEKKPEPAKPKPAQTEKSTNVAALPSGSKDAADAIRKKFESRHEQIVFTDGQDVLSAEALQKLSALAKDMSGNDVRIQLQAHAGTPGDGGSGANRKALKHALLVRDYLVGKGLAESRVIVRAMGPATSGPKDRVDIAFLTQ